MKKKDFISYIAVKLAWLLILVLGQTGIKKVLNRHYLNISKKSGLPIMFVVWHGTMLLPLYAHRNERVVAMVSQHDDGEIIAQTIIRLGYQTVRGSSTRGGTNAYRLMLQKLKQGHNCTILPDGPTGPRHVFKKGAMLLAQRSGAIIQPLTFSARKPISLKTWDKFTLWYPFTRICLAYGKPLRLPGKMDPQTLESYRMEIENRMNALQEEADDFFRK